MHERRLFFVGGESDLPRRLLCCAEAGRGTRLVRILVLSAWLCIVAALPPTVVAALPTWQGAAATAALAAIAAMHRAAQREARPVHVAKCAWHWQ